MMWTPRVRTAGLALADPFRYDELVLVERYGQPDTLVITGDIEDLRPAFGTDSGVYLVDDQGELRFSGVRPRRPQVKVNRLGDGTAQLAYESDLSLLWRRSCWPTPASAWTSQTSPYDIQTAVHEDKILGYINRNAGSIAYNGTAGGVTVDRRIQHLRLPTSLGRGVSAKTTARFQNLGQVVAGFAEAANLRVTIRQTYESGTPFLDVVIDDVPDLSDWARFGDASTGDVGLLGEDWRYGVGAGASVVLSAAGGNLENRLLNISVDADVMAAWGYEEVFIDQRGAEDAGEIAAGLAQAVTENAPVIEVEAPIESGDLTFGPGTGAIPLGAKVAVSLDGELVVDRVRQVTTTISAAAGEPTVRVEPLFGSPDAALSIDEKALRRALTRLRNLEASL